MADENKVKSDVSESEEKESQIILESEEESKEAEPQKEAFKNPSEAEVNNDDASEINYNSNSYRPYNPDEIKNNLIPPAPRPLTNAIKVALTAVCVMVPIIGQFVGLIMSIIFMNSDEELKDSDDRRSFGLALLIACVIAFVVTCFSSFIYLLILAGYIFN